MQRAQLRLLKLLLLVLALYYEKLLSYASAEREFTPPQSAEANSAALQTSAARSPLLMVSTIDGTVSFFDARTGDSVFSHTNNLPAVTSWTTQGMPEYIPSLEGHIYRVNSTTDELEIVDSKFIHRAAVAGLLPPLRAREESDALILKSEQTTAMYIDLQTGRIVHWLSFDDKEAPVLPKLSDNIIIVSRTSVGVRIVESATGRELANATLVHTEPSFLDHGRCPNTPLQQDAFVASVSEARGRITVRDIRTGDVMWSRDVSNAIVEMHGLAGVSISRSGEPDAIEHQGGGALPPGQDQASASSAPANILVGKYGSQEYAMLAMPEDHDGDERASPEGKPRHRGSLRKYKVPNMNGNEVLSRTYRILGIDHLPVPNNESPSATGEEDIKVVLTSRDAGLALLALVVVGYVGYVAGSRPRRSSRRDKVASSRRAVRRKRTSPLADTGFEDQNESSDAEEMPIAEAMLLKKTGISDDSPKSTSNKSSLRIAERIAEVSNGSTSSGAGYVSNRSDTGWMTVGSLMVSSNVLGYGSHGTVVYEGKMKPGDRKVAVKRLLRQFFESARKEISLLVELDEASPHVVRYFAMEEDSEFIYLALELCDGTLAERVTSAVPPVPPPTYSGGPPPNYTSRALRQLLQGLADLHRVGVVHRDVKPQNVLITRCTAGVGDVKLADVGLALRLAANRSSYTAVTNAAGGVGTTGWRAPEVLSGGRQTKAVDIFAAGIVVSFVLTGGKHPFGNAVFGRDGNIAAGKPSLESLEELRLPEATDIVKRMIDPVATNRPSAEEALNHPFFWTDAIKLSFLVDISDRLYDLRHETVRYTENLDRYAYALEHCSDWRVHMDMDLLLDLGRQYETTASALLRIIRNKRNHYSELSPALQKKLGPLPEESNHPSHSFDRARHRKGQEEPSSDSRNFLTYFTSRVPHLLLCVYRYALENPALIDQPHFSRYGLKITQSARKPLELHPLVKRARGQPASLMNSSLEGDIDTSGDSLPEKSSLGSEPIQECEDEEVVVTICTNRRTYHRHELVEMQENVLDMPSDAKQRAIAAEIFCASSHDRIRRRLRNLPIPEEPAAAEETDAFPEEPIPSGGTGFQRLMPRRSGQYGPLGFGPRNPTYSTSPGRVHGFGASGAPHGNHQPPYAPNQGRRPAGRNTTVSQFTGEERVVDFGSLRRVNQ
ncbi:Serine/threonine protein kinase/endoribonuclease ERN [Gracilaria domingensis]|nr:Serine/threonine protein kinase/endoribonuclease ERN [Gracilaria domingensis]